MNRERTLTLLEYELEQANAALRLAHEYAVDSGCGKTALQISRAIVALRPENAEAHVRKTPA